MQFNNFNNNSKYKDYFTLYLLKMHYYYIFISFLFRINTGRMTISVSSNKSQNNQMSDNVDVYHILHTVSAIEKPI